MKKLLYFLLFTTLLISCNNNDFALPLLKFGGLNGNVSKVRESHYTVRERFGEMTPDDIIEIIINEYDNDGHCLQIGSYKEDGSFYFKIKTEWKDGNIVSETHYSNNNNEPIIDLRIVDVSKNHRSWIVNSGKDDESNFDQFLEGLTLTNKEKDEIQTVAIFDKKGNIIEQKDYIGEAKHRTVNEYDEKGNIIKQTIYPETGEPTIRTYSYPDYDDKGNWITQIITEDGTAEEIVKREISYR